MEKKRSKGVTVCGVTMLIYALWPFLIFFFLTIGIRGKFIDLLGFSLLGIILMSGMALGGLSYLLICLSIFAVLIYLVCGIGILLLKNWARVLAVYFSTLLLLPCVFTIICLIAMAIISYSLEGLPESYVRHSMSIIIPFLPPLLFFIFLTRPRVKDQFSPAKVC